MKNFTQRTRYLRPQKPQMSRTWETGILTRLEEAEIKSSFRGPSTKTCFLLVRPSQDVSLLPHIPWIEQRGSILLLVTLLHQNVFACDNSGILFKHFWDKKICHWMLRCWFVTIQSECMKILYSKTIMELLIFHFMKKGNLFNDHFVSKIHIKRWEKCSWKDFLKLYLYFWRKTFHDFNTKNASEEFLNERPTDLPRDQIFLNQF